MIERIKQPCWWTYKISYLVTELSLVFFCTYLILVLVQNDQKFLLFCVANFSHLQNRLEHRELTLSLLHPPPITTQWHRLPLWCTHSHQVRGWELVCWSCAGNVHVFGNVDVLSVIWAVFHSGLAKRMHLVLWKNSKVKSCYACFGKYILKLKEKKLIQWNSYL